jgi:Zn-finger nucleic acid-binding protein
MENSDENIKFDICPECKVRENDSSEKKLYQCPYCKGWFCEKHIEPKLVTTWSAIERTKDPFLKEILYEEWRKEGHHPCSVWTMQYLENFEIEERQKREKFLKALNNVEKIGEINLHDKSSEVHKEKISSKDIAVVSILFLCLFLIILSYFTAAHNITISLFILLVLALIIVIFR